MVGGVTHRIFDVGRARNVLIIVPCPLVVFDFVTGVPAFILAVEISREFAVSFHVVQMIALP